MSRRSPLLFQNVGTKWGPELILSAHLTAFTCNNKTGWLLVLIYLINDFDCLPIDAFGPRWAQDLTQFSTSGPASIRTSNFSFSHGLRRDIS